MAYCSMLYESIEHADDSVVRFGKKKFVLKLKVMRGEFNEFFIIKEIEKSWLCPVLLQSTQEAARALKKWEETFDYVSCFSLQFFLALAASCMLYNRTEHSQCFSIR